MSTIAICVVTQSGREPFWPWTVWNIDNVVTPLQSVVEVDAPVPKLLWVGPRVGRQPLLPCATYSVVAADNMSVAEKRDVAMDAAIGLGAEYLAWVDDDDWQHPMRLLWSFRMLQAFPKAAGVGVRRGCFVDLATGHSQGWTSASIHPVSFVERLSITSEYSFQAELDHPGGHRGTDTRRLMRIHNAGYRVQAFDSAAFVQAWLKHDTNMWPRQGHYGGSFLDLVRDEVEAEYLEGLDKEFAALQQRVAKWR